MNTNHHLSKPVLIGEIQPTASSTSCGRRSGTGDAWSPYLPEDKGKVADWTFPWVCGQLHRARNTERCD